MFERFGRRLSALETKSHGEAPRVLVFNPRMDGDYDHWRSENVLPLETRGFHPLVVKIRWISAKVSA